MITCRSPPPSLLKNSQLNFKTNSGHIYKFKHTTEFWDFQLSNEPKNINNGEELVEKYNDYM